MKIKVDREEKESGELVFTITVSKPESANFGEMEKSMLDILDACQHKISLHKAHDSKLQIDIINLIHTSKLRAFGRTLEQLKRCIKDDLQVKFNPICQEIYNWIYDHQDGVLKSWMIEFDPQRTKYYFDNDIHAQKTFIQQESEHDGE